MEIPENKQNKSIEGIGYIRSYKLTMTGYDVMTENVRL